MKVYISNYRDNWLSPYTILDWVFFWKPWSRCSRRWTLTDSIEDTDRVLAGGRSRYVERPDWVDVWADRLMPISLALQWIGERVRPQITFVKIDRWDTWSMDHTLAHIVLPMLRQLKQTKHGAPLVDDEDVPEHLRSTSAPPKEQEYDTDGNHFARWDWVMDEMIFAFEHRVDDSWQDQFHTGHADYVSIPIDKDGNEVAKGEHCFYRMEHGPKHTHQCDHEGMNQVQQRMDNGFRLFGKYYQGLWD
jgi:hypothetical protein